MRIPRIETERTHQGWLALRRSGLSVLEIARECGAKPKTVQAGILAARRKEPPIEVRWRVPLLVPLFTIEPFTPMVSCPHRGPIKRGSVFCCMVCDQSGLDGHPALYRDPRTTPKPDKRPHKAPAPKLTRKERRAIA